MGGDRALESGELFYSLNGPLDAVPRAQQVRAANLHGFSDLARRAGADPVALLDRHGLDLRVVRDPDSFIECRALVDLLEDCGSRLNEPLFGLKLAQAQGVDVYGCVTALCRACASLEDAIEGMVAYLPVIHSPEAVTELRRGKQTAELRWGARSDLGVNDQANLQAVLLNANLLRMLGGPRFTLSYVSLVADVRPRDVAEIEARVGCVVRRGDINAVGFPVEALGHPISSANRLLVQLIGGYLARLKAGSRTRLTDQVEAYVRGALSSGGCSIEKCADKLGYSVRTLQARLADDGARFSEIVERQRIEVAKAYLAEEGASLDEVAALLGYSEQTSFGRAFKRWTGTTPQKFRGSEEGRG
jgi:AraC-like DNA-binding protein